ncbi:DUF4173 domain-containing protein [Sulfuricurvum sp. RIFCSPLOWO2_12_FULL_43_24]|uniref:DUF4153 domain-containing protein n=1 Tax=Sulfuricurvum sp. RIFCSPLOWO2_12_FULL_43_24 TaxID=1802247 RepID=UPI0008CF625C|nr:DUF4173 domain-containing protein [Sulfuricurvum sp. RIFCSPLOWO2_12_FULL_43_24]OHD90597.1 MAG: hypothetical protein A3G19_11880 [Sulfuricurvum sp. RIFCSPLOWO2_12_FULL_43_24]
MANLTEEIRTVDLEGNRFANGWFSVTLIGVSLVLALFQSFFVPKNAVGLGNILFFLIAMIPMLYLALSAQVINRYTLWILPFVTVWIADVFIYNNTLTQAYLPAIIVSAILIVYLTSMHKVDHLYQTLIPRLLVAFSPWKYFRAFFSNLFALNPNYSIYKRIFKGVLVTVPFIALFLALFMNADTKFNSAVNRIIELFAIPKIDQMISVPLYFFLFLGVYLYSYLNRAERPSNDEAKAYDKVIVGIFLGGLNTLFAAFLAFQIAYLFGGEAYITQSGITHAQFARQGFFQLAWVIGLVVVIFLGMMRRYKGEMSIQILMGLFMVQTVIMGIASLKKMHLYQTLMGMTTLRYYVEWFEYFLIAVLVVGIVLMIIRQSYHVILSTVTAMGLIAFTLVASLNVDYMIASHNVAKFQNDPTKLDTEMLSNLSIDALPALTRTPVMLSVNFSKGSCNSAMQYHYGRCKLIQKYGDTQLYYTTQRNTAIVAINPTVEASNESF